MNTTLLIFFNLITNIGGEIPEAKLTDKSAEIAINAFIDSINAINGNKAAVNYHINARVENAGKSKFVYLCTVITLEDFKVYGMPDKYSRIGGRFVFWYETKKTDASRSFNELRQQFGSFPRNDLDSADTASNLFQKLWLDVYTFIGGTYRFVMKNNAIVSASEICDFPGIRFFEKGLAFDKNGDLMVRRNVYHMCALDVQNLLHPENFDPNDYIRSHSGIPEEIIQRNTIQLKLVVNKRGKVVEVVIDDREELLDENQKKQLSHVILQMPRWNPQTVKGKKVCFMLDTVP
jgi:hypothetical protein